MSSYGSKHLRITIYLLIETVLLYVGLALVANWLSTDRMGPYFWLAYIPVLLMQGFWLDRIYIVGHEATHKKLFPNHPRLNDLTGSVILLPLMVPIGIYRKIHYFHHGFNRKDHHTSVLDVYVSQKPITPLRRFWYYLVWYIGVFAGGYFLHSLISVVIMLFLPTSTAVKISPAFKGWKVSDRLRAWAFFLIAIGLQVAVAFIFGQRAWLRTFVWPMLAFSWIWSLLVYIFHYDTSIGQKVQYNVRSLPRHWFFSWVLMNFNEHTTHHTKPNIPWYLLPDNRIALPEEFQHNQKVGSIWAAILQQLKGPTIVYDPEKSTPQ